MITEPKKLRELIPEEPQDYNNLPEKQKKHSEVEMAVIKKYGNALKFAETFNPDMQRVCAENIERAFMGEAPTITILRRTYNDRQIRIWIIAQIESINQYTGVKDKMEFEQMKGLAEVIMTWYGYLKATELMVFFHQFKAGKYGQLYGAVDPMRISAALNEFLSYRKEITFKLKADQEREKRNELIENHQRKIIENQHKT